MRHPPYSNAQDVANASTAIYIGRSMAFGVVIVLSAVGSNLNPPPDIRKEEASRMLEDALQRDDDMCKG